MSFKRNATIIAAAGGVSYLAYSRFVNSLFKKAFVKAETKYDNNKENIHWFNSSNVTQINIESFDGLILNAYDIHNHDNNNYMIIIHGIWGNSSNMFARAKGFDALGYNILLLDQRTSGKSQGEYYTYGFKESMDLCLWIDYLCKKYKDVNIALLGMSMGAATVMMSTQYSLPTNVKCIIEDCGFSSIEEQFDHNLKQEYKLSFTKLVLTLLEAKMKKYFGITFDDINIKNVLEQNEIPIMFIHGQDDNFVPYEMSIKLYNHNKGEKKFYPVPKAKHTQANNDPNYYNNIDLFIRSYLS